MANIINGTDTGSGGLITTGDSSDELQLQTAETARVTLTNTAVVVNEGGNDVDFRVEGDTDANLLFVDASADKVGIGTNAPGSIFSVSAASPAISLTATTTTGTTLGNKNNRFLLLSNSVTVNAGGEVVFGTADTDIGRWGAISGAITGNSGGGATGDIIFATKGSTGATTLTERMRVLAGGGLTFNGDTAAANALDDYEEGTWTPSIRGSTTAGTYELATATGRYTKIGNIVMAEADIVFAAAITGGGAGDFQIRGWPFTPTSDSNYQAGAFYVIQSTRAGTTFVRLRSSGIGLFYSFDNAGNRTIEAISRAAANGSINVTIVYQAT